MQNSTQSQGKKIEYERIIEIIFMVVCLLQIMFLAYMNIVHMEKMVDYDSSCALMHSREVWKQKTLFIKDWGYQTTIDLDSIVGLVALLYGLTGNIFIAQALGNILIICLYFRCLSRIMDLIEINKPVKYIIITLVLIPYSLGQLGYFPMLFGAGAFYTIRTILPLTLISILLELSQSSSIKQYWFRLIIVAMMSFFAGLSSGVYVLLCGFAPILVYEIISVIIKDDYRELFSHRVAFELIVCLCAVIGVASEGAFGYSTKATTMALVDAKTWMAEFGKYFVGIYELFGGVSPRSEVPLLSSEGIAVIIKWALTSILLLSMVYRIIKSIKKKQLSIIDGTAFSIFAVNFFVLTLLDISYGSDTFEYRYHLIPMLPLFVLLSESIEDILSFKNKSFVVACCTCLTVICLGAVFISDIALYKQGDNATRDNYRELGRIVQENEADTVIINNDSMIARCGRTFLGDAETIDAGVDWNIAGSWGESKKVWDACMQGDCVMLVSTPENLEWIPEFILNQFTFVTTWNNREIYLLGEKKIDFTSGLPTMGNVSIDYPYTYGYATSDADFDENGMLVSNGNAGCILRGTGFSGIEGVYDISINYNVISGSDVAGIFSIYSKDRELANVIIDSESQSVTMQGIKISENDKDLVNRVDVEEGTIIKIESITMKRIS